MPLFQKLMSPDKRYRYWMKYFQLPAARSPDELDLVGCSKHKIAEFWRLAMFLQSQFLRVVTVQDIIMMSSFSASYITSMQKYYSLHSPIVFWGILMVSTLRIPWEYSHLQELESSSDSKFEFQTTKILNFLSKLFRSDKQPFSLCNRLTNDALALFAVAVFVPNLQAT